MVMVDDVVGYFLQYLGLGGYFYMDWEPYVKFESKGYVVEDFVRHGYGWGSKVCDGIILCVESKGLLYSLGNLDCYVHFVGEDYRGKVHGWVTDLGGVRYLRLRFKELYCLVRDGVVLLREGFSLEFFVLNGYKENTMLCRHVDHFVFNRHSGVSLGGIKLDFMNGRTYDEDVSLYEMVRGYDFGASIYNVLSECGDYLWNGV